MTKVVSENDPLVIEVKPYIDLDKITIKRNETSCRTNKNLLKLFNDNK
jgi:hypothetical protein